MATCERKEIVVPKPPMEYVLTLNAEEAALVVGALNAYNTLSSWSIANTINKARGVLS